MTMIGRVALGVVKPRSVLIDCTKRNSLLISSQPECTKLIIFDTVLQLLLHGKQLTHYRCANY